MFPQCAPAAAMGKTRGDDAAPTTRDGLELKPRGGVKNKALLGRKFTGGARASPFIRQWAWKREMKTDEARFRDDYVYDRDDDEDDANPKATIRLRQRKFNAASSGFASTVWDSAIVLSKYLEKRNRASGAGARWRDAVELGAGCGLCACVLAKRCENLVTGTIYATDVAENMDLLTENVKACSSRIAPLAYDWRDAPPKSIDASRVDLILGTDLVYYDDAMPALVKTLKSFESEALVVYFAFGRNRQALPRFLECFDAEARDAFEEPRFLESHELDALYQCTDVSVMELKRK